MGTFAYSGVMLAFFEMADKAGAVGDYDMFSLNNLRMAACASKLLASFEVIKVDCVVENDFVKFDLTLENSFIVTSLSKTGFIGYFSPGL